ncbi:MAG: hypothetical protein JWM85_1115 [Acidimicrobiaceae bacterium]|nr:hypothetical protein [Acidimicrobiaceae bacterium]
MKLFVAWYCEDYEGGQLFGVFETLPEAQRVVESNHPAQRWYGPSPDGHDWLYGSTGYLVTEVELGEALSV